MSHFITNESMQLKHTFSYLPKNLGCNMQIYRSTPADESSGFCLAQCLLTLAMIKLSA